MTLTVIEAGLGRTGTYSTQIALNQLGFPCYHLVPVILKVDPTGARSPVRRQDRSRTDISLIEVHSNRRLSRLRRLA
ncbi:sulfotransferase [Roseiarcus sp.]|uniref:sulfotransferase n=1 Tax=Roseiarcus sp. TaxID=1969460 RepID=UPI003C4BFFA2